jgi:hypothetical protein
MVTPELSVIAKHALQDMVELRMYLLAQSQQKPWPMLHRTRTNSIETARAHSTSVELSAANELLNLGLIEASSRRTFVVSSAGYLCYDRTITRLLA